jgi:hypothetical protein
VTHWHPPKNLTIAGQRWRLKRSRGALSPDWLGRYDARHCRIDVDPEIAPSSVGEVWMHEVLHACGSLTGLWRNEEVAKHEEQIVSALAPILFDTFRRNKLRFDTDGE